MSAQRCLFAIERAHVAAELAHALARDTPRASVLKAVLGRINDARTLAREGLPVEALIRLAEAVEDLILVIIDDIDRPSGVYRSDHAATPEHLIVELERFRGRAILFGLDGAQALLDVMIAGLRSGLGVKAPHAQMLRDAASARARKFAGTALDEIYGGAARAVDGASALATSSRRSRSSPGTGCATLARPWRWSAAWRRSTTSSRHRSRRRSASFAPAWTHRPARTLPLASG